MRSRPPSARRGPLGLVALVALAALVAGLLSATGSSASTHSWGINAGGDIQGWYPDTRNAPSPAVNHGEADLRTSSSSTRVDLSHPSVPQGTPEALYRTQRGLRPGPNMVWTLPLGGADTVRLHFAETRDRFWVRGGAVSDVLVNGQVAIDDLDVFAEVGANRALVKELRVSGDVARIELRTVAGWPSIAGVEVVGGQLSNPQPTPTTQAPTTTKAPTTTQAPPTTQAPAPSPDGTKLSFRPPALTNPTTIQVSNTNRALRLEAGKDYIVKMPSTPLSAMGGLNISGGRNVVLIGGHIHFDRWYDGQLGKVNRGMYLQNQTGTIHIEGVRISGNVGEGINLSQTLGGIVQLQNIRIEGATGTKAGNHADLIQSWAGPRQLRIDGFTGYTNYQGFFLLPNQWFDGPAPELFDLRNINLVGDPAGAGYLYWVDETRQRFPVRHQNLWAQPSAGKAGNPDQFLWPRPSTGDRTWDGVREGVPAGGDLVTRSEAGIGYVSPGYAG